VTARVLGIGGIFFKARDPERLLAWYREHLGLDIGEWGGVVFEASLASPRRPGRDPRGPAVGGL
jgi:catechol 2,3-dioxygenase-like lactoylglutathione lyase family enzyme